MNKRKMFTLALCVCMIAILAVGGTLAYMFDTDHQVNVFTAGEVGLNLTEAVVELDEKDNYVDTGARFDDDEDKANGGKISQTYYDIHPNMTIYKDPTIEIDQGSKPCYVGAKVTITGNDFDALQNLLDMDGVDEAYIDIHKLASGELVDETATFVGAWNGYSFAFETKSAVICQEIEYDENGEGMWVLYIFIKDVKKAGDKIILFDTLTIPASYTNEDMAVLNDMEIDVKAYGVQAAGFEYLGDQACFVAMTEAFGTDDENNGEWNWPGKTINNFVDGGVGDVLRVEGQE